MNSLFEPINFRIYEQNFTKQINKFSLKFKEPDMENAFQTYKNDPIRILKSFVRLTIFLMGVISLKFLIYLITLYLKNKETLSLGLFIISIAVSIIVYGLEIVFYNVFKLKEFKGILLTNFLVLLLFLVYRNVPQSNQGSNDILFLFLAVSIFISNLSVAYFEGWLISLLCMFITFIILTVFTIITWPLNVIAIISNIIVYLVIFLLIVVSSFIREYEKRYLYFTLIMSERNFILLDQFIAKVPIPIIKSEIGKIISSNSAFSENVVDCISEVSLELKASSNYNIELSNSLKAKEICEQIKDNEKGIPLSEFIKNGLEIKEQLNFTLSNFPQKLFSIKSISFDQLFLKSFVYFILPIDHTITIEQLKKRIKSMGIYMSSVAHDFKTPLNMISNTMDAYLFDNSFPEEVKKDLKNVKESAQLILFMVQDIMDYSQIENNSLRIASIKFNFREQIIDNCYAVAHSFEKEDVNFEVQIDPNIPDFIISDKNRIKQIVMNLLSNAFKFTLVGSIIVSAKLVEKSSIEISISDTGQGIKEEDLSKLFKDFCKIDDPSNLNPLGVGLGLSICKKIAIKLGGDIGVISKYGEGSKFFFTFQFTCPSLNLKDEENLKSQETIQKNSNHSEILNKNENKNLINSENTKNEYKSNNSQIFIESSSNKIIQNVDNTFLKKKVFKTNIQNSLKKLRVEPSIGECSLTNNIYLLNPSITNKKQIITISDQGREIFDFFHEVKEELPKIMEDKEEIKQANNLREAEHHNIIYKRQRTSLENEENNQQGRGLNLFLSLENINPKSSTISFKPFTSNIISDKISINNPLDKYNIHNYKEKKEGILSMKETHSSNNHPLKSNTCLKNFRKKDIEIKVNVEDNVENKAYSFSFQNDLSTSNIIPKIIVQHEYNQIEKNKSPMDFLETKIKKNQIFESKGSGNLNLKESNNQENPKRNIPNFKNDCNNDECLSNRKLLEKNELDKAESFYASNVPKPDCQCSFILIVDDQAFNRAPLVSFCKKQKLKYEEASDGEKAFLKAKKKTESNCCKVYGFIFLDFNMPGINGVQTAEKIRELEDTLNLQHSRIIGLSGNIEDFDTYNTGLSKKLFWAKSPKPIDTYTFNELIHGDNFVDEVKKVE